MISCRSDLSNVSCTNCPSAKSKDIAEKMCHICWISSCGQLNSLCYSCQQTSSGWNGHVHVACMRVMLNQNSSIARQCCASEVHLCSRNDVKLSSCYSKADFCKIPCMYVLALFPVVVIFMQLQYFLNEDFCSVVILDVEDGKWFCSWTLLSAELSQVLETA